MGNRPPSDAEVLANVEAIRRHGSARAASIATGASHMTVLRNLQRARDRGLADDLPPAERHAGWVDKPVKWTRPRVLETTLKGIVLAGGDMHTWDGAPHPIWQAFCDAAATLQPAAIVLNGDMIDGARLSRHPKMRGQQTPTIGAEIDAVRERLGMLPPGGERFWTWGNHDNRLDGYLANMAPELDDFAGTLEDRFPEWRFAYSVMVNGHTEIRHRFRSGIHARWNNSLHAGLNIVTSHTHQLGVTPVVDRRGTRWGVEIGMLCDPTDAPFEYNEGAPNRQEVGFAVLTFDDDGDLMEPELCRWRKGAAWFRGAPVKAARDG